LSSTLSNIFRDLDNASFKFENIASFFSKDVVNVLQHSENSCLVGGCVRDTLIGKTPKDFDFVTDIPYDDLEKLFIDAGFTVKEAGKQFLVLIVSKDGVDYEIANYRKDGTYVDGRRPESVEFGTIYDDAERRDFTVNALYFNLTTFRLIDPTAQGLDDIKSRTLRFVGKPASRLKDDLLRVFRFYRFLDKGFTPEPRSLSAVRDFFDDACKKTSSERIRVELERITMR
jgi:tRNA nucleotidyltransferase/poly(A) polymerase